MQRIHLFLVVGVILALSRGATAATLLVANKSAATVTLYDLPSGSERARIPTGDGPHEVAVSPDGQRAVITNYGDSDEPGASLTIVYIPTASAQRTVELPAASRPHGAQWLDDRHVAVTAEGIDALLLVDVDAGTVLETLPVDQAIAHMVAVTADGRRAYTANIGSGTVTVLDLAAGSKLRDIASGDGAEGIALVNGGRELWVSNRAADTVAVFDGDSLERIATLEAPGFPIRVEADAARRRVFVTLPARDRMAVYDARSRELLQEIAFDIPPDPRCLAT